MSHLIPPVVLVAVRKPPEELPRGCVSTLNPKRWVCDMLGAAAAIALYGGKKLAKPPGDAAKLLGGSSDV